LNALLIEVVSVIHDTCPCDPSSGSGPKNRDFRRISFPVLFAKLSFIWAWRSLLTIFNASRRRTPWQWVMAEELLCLGDTGVADDNERKTDWGGAWTRRL